MNPESESSFGLGHLSAHPITLTFGTVLIGALLLLILLRVLFASVDVRGGVR